MILYPNRTPYYRVLPVEAALDEAAPQVEVKLDQPVSDPRRALPLDIVSEMVKAEPLVAVAECYCRRARKIVGEGLRPSAGDLPGLQRTG